MNSGRETEGGHKEVHTTQSRQMTKTHIRPPQIRNRRGGKDEKLGWKKWKLKRKHKDYCKAVAPDIGENYCFVIFPVHKGLEGVTIHQCDILPSIKHSHGSVSSRLSFKYYELVSFYQRHFLEEPFLDSPLSCSSFPVALSHCIMLVSFKAPTTLQCLLCSPGLLHLFPNHNRGAIG